MIKSIFSASSARAHKSAPAQTSLKKNDEISESVSLDGSSSKRRTIRSLFLRSEFFFNSKASGTGLSVIKVFIIPFSSISETSIFGENAEKSFALIFFPVKLKFPPNFNFTAGESLPSGQVH